MFTVLKKVLASVNPINGNKPALRAMRNLIARGKERRRRNPGGVMILPQLILNLLELWPRYHLWCQVN